MPAPVASTFKLRVESKTWMAGTSPAPTGGESVEHYNGWYKAWPADARVAN